MAKGGRRKGNSPPSSDLAKLDADAPAIAASRALVDAVHAAEARIAATKAAAQASSYYYGARAAPTPPTPAEIFADESVALAADDAATALAQQLATHYHASQLYTWAGSAAMVAVSPPAMSTILAELTSEAEKEKWFKMYKNMRGDPLPSQLAAFAASGRSVPATRDPGAHVYALANALFFHLRRSGVDQSLILRGESGSGKSMQADLLIQQLCNISGSSKRDERTHRRVLASHAVLAAFGSARTAASNDASRYGAYYELQFSERGKLVGMQLLAYGLERCRVLRQRLGERNFHAFYYLLAGAAPELRAELGLSPDAVFPYLTYGTNPPSAGIDDAGRFVATADAMRAVGIGKRAQYQVWKLVAAILHLGNVRFIDAENRLERESCQVANLDALAFVAGLLEVDPTMLAVSLTQRTTKVGRDLVTQLLTVDEAESHRDSLAMALYAVLFAWMVEQVNKKVAADDEMANFIGIVDFPSASLNEAATDETFRLAFAYATEQLDGFLHKRVFEYGNAELRAEGMAVQDTPYPRPTVAADRVKANSGGAEGIDADVFPGDFINLFRGGNGQGGSRSPVYHELFSETIISMDAFENNAATVIRGHSLMRRKPSTKRISTISGGGSNVGLSSSPNVGRSASSSSATLAAGGGARTKGGKAGEQAAAAAADAPESELSVLIHQIDTLVDALDSTHAKALYCLRPNTTANSTVFDSKLVRSKLAALGLPLVLGHIVLRTGEYTLRFAQQAFVDKYGSMFRLDDVPEDDARAAALKIKAARNMADNEMHVGATLVVLRDDAWMHLENALRKREHDAKRRSKAIKAGGAGAFPNARDRPLFNAAGAAAGGDSQSEYSFDDFGSVYSDGDGIESQWGEGDSLYNDSVADDMATNYDAPERNMRVHDAITRNVNAALDGKHDGSNGDSQGIPDDALMEEYQMTGERKRWIRTTWCLTWWIPTPFLRWCGGMKRADVRMAWREKVAICILIFLACAAQLFIIIGFGKLICPRQNILNLNELYFKNGFRGQEYIGIYGAVYDLSTFTQSNHHDQSILSKFAGYEVTAGFPRTPSYYCEYAADPRFGATNLQPLMAPTATANGTYIQIRHREFYEQNPYAAQMYMDVVLRSNIVSYIGWDPSDIKTLSTSANSAGNRLMFSYKSRVYDLQPYINNAQNASFLPIDTVSLIIAKRGTDLSDDPQFVAYWQDKKLRDCFNNLFTVGVVDYRKSARCMFTNYILLAFSILLACVIGGKFIAALQLTSSGTPEEHEKFVLLLVPCYTEGEDSLKRTIDSLAALHYDDKRKLMFVVCDGNIMGSGNDRPTPRIVLDILGVDPNLDPEPLSFQSLGEGMRQHNRAKVYSGLYECQGHLVPYVVVAKMGKPSEASRPGNRGKRDSQMILMRFLNKVMFDMAMSPMELELYHHIKNVIGVNPSFYEYVLMVDADTVVMRDSLARMVSVMIHDTKVMGVCGETRLSNERDTWSTMIQVYEYFISHHLAKAFESLFGSVTCLPGCFSMYRIRSPNKNAPLLVSNQMIEDYGENMVDTLHKKNLLHLGEDRYLTTLLLKHFPNHRTVFTAAAKCDTVAPDQWAVLLSQRRRWINSTIHNLVELLGISQLCGFCCFSMRFVVFIDLLATLIQPAIVGYLGYLIYLIVVTYTTGDTNNFPTISLILLGTIYGLQAFIFMIKREWQHIGWMIIYILAIPVFSFFIPVYSFWAMDDFSWGQTRVVVGESGRKQVMVAGEEAQKFDMASIPHKRWSEHEAEMHLGGLDEEAYMLHPSSASVYGGGGGVGDPMMDLSGYTASGGGMGGVPDDMRSVRSGYSAHIPMMDMKRASGMTGGYGSRPGSIHSGYEPKRASYGSATGYAANGGNGGADLKRSNSSHTQATAFSVGQYYGGVNGGVNGGAGGGGPPVPALPSPGMMPAATALGGFPTDEEIYYEVRRILSTADLMQVTKKQVRDELSALFGVDLSSRRELINEAISAVLENGV
ncbi:chitin synthase-domain-containing protein [Blastocladiella britannica]|nr:chitin synthase-domain-containing protein [Blastocladiella britannica]